MSNVMCARAASLENVIWENGLTMEQEAGLRSHAVECATCRALWEEIQEARYALKTYSEKEILAPDSNAAWERIRNQLAKSHASSWVWTGGLAVGLSAVVVFASFVALGGPTRNMFSGAVGKVSMGANQAALRGGVYQSAPTATEAIGAPSNAVNGALPMSFADNRATLRPGAQAIPNSIADEVPITSPRRVQRSALMTLQVAEVRPVFKRVTGIVAEAGGIVISSNVVQPSGNSGSTATVTVKIPTERFDGVVTNLHELGEIVSENIEGLDKTDEYRDIEGTLRDKNLAMETLRARLTDKTIASEELARVQAELDRLRAERDQIESARRTLESITNFSTMTIILKEGRSERKGLSLYINQFTDRFSTSLGIATALCSWGVSAIVVITGATLPWLILVLPVWRWRRRRLAW